MTLPLLLGAIVGLTLGVLGGGGSILAIPFLTYGLGLEPKPAVATSLGVVGAAALLASVIHARAGHLQWRVALVFGALGAVGAAIGSQLARFLPGALQLVIFSGVMLFVGVRMVRSARKGEEDEEAGEDAPPPQAFSAKVVVAALLTGVLTGVVGVGGGFLIVPALVFLVGLTTRQAIGTSLAVIVLNSVGGSLGYSSYVELDLRLALPFVLGAALAGVAGSWIGQKISPARLRMAFGVGIVLVGLAMGAHEGWNLLHQSGAVS